MQARNETPIILVLGICPLCRARVQGRASQRPVELTCGSCGMRFVHEPARRKHEDSGGNNALRDPLAMWLAGEPVSHWKRGDSGQLAPCRRKRSRATVFAGLAATLLVCAAILGAMGYAATTARLWQAGQAKQLDTDPRLLAEWVAEQPSPQPAMPQRPFEVTAQQAQPQRTERETEDGRPNEAERSLAQVEHERQRAEQQRVEAAREARISLAVSLASDSQKLLATHPLHSLFLAGESLRAKIDDGVAPDHATEQVLRDALAVVGFPGLKGHEGPILRTVITPDSRWLATASVDSTVRLWSLGSEMASQEPIVLRGHRGPVTALAASPDARWLISGGHDGLAILWRLVPSHPEHKPMVFQTRSGRVHAVAVSPDGRWLVTAGGVAAGESSVAELWDLAAKDPTRGSIPLRGHQRPILTVAVSPDGRWLATAGEDKTVRVWNLAGRHPAAEQVVLRGHDGWVGVLAVSPDGRWLASGSYDGTARLWSLDPLDPAAEPVVLRGHEGWIGAMEFSPNGRWLATGSFDRTVRLWDFRAERIAASPMVLPGHDGRVQSLAFTPDSRRLVSGSYDATARLWDLAVADPTAQPTILRGHQGPINSLSVSADGRWLVSGSGETFERRDNTARLWDIGLDTLLENARLVASRELTPQRREEMLLEAARRDEPTHRPR